MVEHRGIAWVASTLVKSRASRLGAVIAFFAMAALLLPGKAQAANYYSERYFSVSIQDQMLQVTANRSVLPTTTTNSNSCVVYYDWDFDGSWVANWSHADDKDTADYDKSISCGFPAEVASQVLPLDPRYQVYFVHAFVTVGADTYRTQAIVVNNRAEVVVANDEPTPVRIQEIGLASEATTLSADALPVSLDASVSINTSETTLPVSVTSILGESDGRVLWAVVGGLCGLFSLYLIRSFRTNHE